MVGHGLRKYTVSEAISKALASELQYMKNALNRLQLYVLNCL